MNQTTVISKSGDQKLSLVKWIEQLPGIKLTIHESDTKPIYTWIKLEKIAEEEVQIPNLELIGIKENLPPVRTFQEVE